MIKCVVCGKQAVREFVSRTIFTDLEQDRFALCEDHKETLYDFLAQIEMEEEERDETESLGSGTKGDAEAFRG